MLDDLKYIHQRDGQDALGIAEKQWQQLEYNFELPKIEGQFENIVFAGMGGSALAALISVSWPGHKLPFEVCRQYHTPSYISAKTLFIASSYSGNTEETLSALAEAEARGAQIVIIAGGGKLVDIASTKNYPVLVLPQVSQPRYAVLYGLRALIAALNSAGLAKEGLEAELNNAKEFIKVALEQWLPTVPSDRNPAKKLAIELAGKTAVIYAGPLLAPIAYKWKISFNENAKNVAWWNQFPEFNHNEMIGWSSHPIEKPYGIIELRSQLEHKRVQRRFEVSERLLSGLRPAPHIVEVEGSSLLEQLVWAMVYGDFVTIYMALLNGVNPSPVDLVEKFKKELG